MKSLWIELVGSTLFVCLGLYSAIFHNTLGRKATDFQSKIFQIHTNDFMTRGTQIGYLIVGIFFVIFGVWMLFRIFY